ncbi:hypothetical protein BIW11_05615 [Tropilaelaps mercedesae]|uniref:Uncharacterized protein n=1 Tax=Tropilaelaps mercedesae TaxID=418985 RepID=A0A1V9Y1M7_9ACAR|nr:hypothetical protein BIW11_05615 [Tropilaelaps mercedesae]
MVVSADRPQKAGGRSVAFTDERLCRMSGVDKMGASDFMPAGAGPGTVVAATLRVVQRRLTESAWPLQSMLINKSATQLTTGKERSTANLASALKSSASSLGSKERKQQQPGSSTFSRSNIIQNAQALQLLTGPRRNKAEQQKFVIDVHRGAVPVSRKGLLIRSPCVEKILGPKKIYHKLAVPKSNPGLTAGHRLPSGRSSPERAACKGTTRLA